MRTLAISALALGAVPAGSGLFGQIYNETGSTLRVWTKRWPGPCRLDTGRAVACSIGTNSFITLTAEDRNNAPGTAIRVEDRPTWSAEVATWFQRPYSTRCAADNSEPKTLALQEDSAKPLEGIV